MRDLEEFRYPFNTSLEFFASYWSNVASFHLDFALICVLILAFQMVRSSRPAGQKLLALYFGLTMFNNPAFQVVPGATLGDLFGIACVVYCAFKLLLNPARRFGLSPIGTSLCLGGVLLTVHAVFIAFLYPLLNTTEAYPDFIGGSIPLTRVLVLAKVFVLGICCLMFERTFRNAPDCWWLVRQIINFALIGVAVYLLQLAVLLCGVIPYGTFLDAGYVGFPSFGSVSIERGHFGKFLTPLFPLFLLSFFRQRRRLAFAFYSLVTLINFSASSLSFFALYVLHTVAQYRSRFLKARYAAIGFISLVALCCFVAATWSLWAGLAAKVENQAIAGNAGGRGLPLLLSYLQKFPLGISYGGSSLRTPPSLGEMNSGLYSFIAQTSFLAVPLIGAFLYLVLASVRRCREIPDLYVRRALQTGVLVMPFIFFTDILWFVPTIWLPMLLVARFSRMDAAAQPLVVRHKTLRFLLFSKGALPH